MAKVIILGTKDTAELAWFYLTHDSPHEVIAFSVNRDYMTNTLFCGLPVVAFEEVENIYPPNEFRFFVPMTARGMNIPREHFYSQAKNKGYRLISYISSKATLFDNPIGENCFILENNVIQPFVSIGDNVVLWSGNHIGHHTSIKSHNFLTSHVVVSGHCIIEPYCFFGGNACIEEYLHIAEGTFLSMGSRLAKNTDPWSIYTGNPARKRKADSRKFYRHGSSRNALTTKF